jgi:hypothetical protein
LNPRSLVLLLCLACLLAWAPAQADSIFVLLAPRLDVADTTLRTEVAVANPGREAKSITLLVHANGETIAGAPISRTVAAGGTMILTGLAPDGRSGALELTGAPELVVTARLVVVRKGRATAAVAMPAVTAANAANAGETVQIQGLARSLRLASRVGVLNLGDRPAACQAQAFRADGSALGAEAHTTVPALSQLAWGDLLGGAEVTEARAQVTCDQPFYAYAVRGKTEGADPAFLAPSGRLSRGLTRGTLRAADAPIAADGEEGKAQSLPDGEGFQIPGVFLDAAPGDTVRAYSLPAVGNVLYKRVSIEWDLHVSQWQTPVFHGIASLRRSGRNRAERVLYAGLLVRPDRKSTIVDLGNDKLVRTDSPWDAETDYHLVLVFDARSRRVTFQMWRDGELVSAASGRSNNNELRNLANGRSMMVDFGMAGIADGAYFPPAPGWQYKNLVVRMGR